MDYGRSTLVGAHRLLATILISFQASPELGGEAESGQFYPDHGSAWVWCALGRVW